MTSYFGSVNWRVLLTDIEHRTVSELVQSDYRTADVFKNFGIAFCCADDHSVREACEMQAIDFSRLLYALESLPEESSISIDYSKLSLEELLDKMEYRTHRFFRSELPNITLYLEKVFEVHHKQIPELADVLHWWKFLSSSLTEHLIKLEFAIYPHIRKLLVPKQIRQEITRPLFGSIAQVQNVFETEQMRMKGYMARMSAISDSFSPPFSWCNTVSVSYKKLASLDRQLQDFFQIEMQQIFPAAIALEQKFNLK